ncbi:hypothetical protein [Streptomyces noursei]
MQRPTFTTAEFLGALAAGAGAIYADYQTWKALSGVTIALKVAVIAAVTAAAVVFAILSRRRARENTAAPADQRRPNIAVIALLATFVVQGAVIASADQPLQLTVVRLIFGPAAAFTMWRLLIDLPRLAAAPRRS